MIKKRIIAVILLFSLVLLTLNSCGGGEFSAPDFKMTDIDGKDVMLSDFAGKPIVLNFWASWCPPCKAEMPDLEEAYNEYGDRVEFIIVNMTGGSETVESARTYIESMGYTFPIYFDVYSEAALLYDISSIPRTYFINKDGTQVSSVLKMISAEELEDGIKSILD